MKNRNQLFHSTKKSISFTFLFYIFIIIINISFISSDNNYVFFPLKRKNNTYLQTLKNTVEIMRFIYLEPLISEIPLGTPEQKTDIIFRTDCTYIYFTSYNHNTSKPDQASDFIQKKYGNFKYFNEEESSSANFLNKTYFQGIYPYNNQYFTKCFNENVKINDKKIKLDLMLTKSIEYEESGAICLQLIEDDYSILQLTPSFPVLLKRNFSLIDNYNWFIYYGKKNEKDYLVIGTSLNEFTNPENGKKFYPNIDMDTQYEVDKDELRIRKAEMTLKFQDIYLIDSNGGKEKFEDEKNFKGKLMPNIGVIVGTTNYSEYLEKNVFGIYLKLGKCNKSIFSQRPNLVGEEYSYYYCDESIYNNIRGIFKNIIFRQVILSVNFELTFDDLFLRQNGYLIFLVIFSSHQHFNWDLGTPFLKKYQFDYNFEKLQIGYYHIQRHKDDDEDEPNNNFWKYLIITFLILLLIGISLAVGIYLGRKYFKYKKRRANELKDDDFEYEEGKKEKNIILKE